MNTNLFEGELVRLSAANSEKDAEHFARWGQDSEFLRLMDSELALPQSVKEAKEAIVKWMETERPDAFNFLIRARDDDKPLGFIGLNGIRWNHGDTFVGIGLGEREYWGKGYGTDAMRVILRYAFTELNLHRVSLSVFEYNPRAQRAYEKCGFRVEGRERQLLHRDGKRYDVIFMGILKEE